MPDEQVREQPDGPAERDAAPRPADGAGEEARGSLTDLIKQQREALKHQKEPDRPPMFTSGLFGRPEIVSDDGQAIVRGTTPGAASERTSADGKLKAAEVAERDSPAERLAPSGRPEPAAPRYDATAEKDGVGRLLTDGTVLVERPSGGAVAFDPHGRVVAAINKRGETFEFGYDTSGRLSSVTNPDGKTWTTEDGLHWTSDDGIAGTGRVSVAPDGTIVETDGDNNTISRKLDGSILLTDAANRVTATVNAAGESFQYGYGADGRLNMVTMPDGTTWASADGNSWSRGQGDSWQGTYSLATDGTLTETNIFGDTVIRRPDGTVQSKDVGTGRTSVRDAAGNWKETQRALDPVEIARASDALYQAMHGGTGIGTNKEAIWAVLEGRSQAERRAINRDYVTRYGRPLREEFKGEMEGAELEKSLYLLDLDRQDGVPPDAGRIRTALTELGQWVEGRSSANIEKDIRLTLSTMNSEEISRLDSEYQRLYGTSVRQALMSNPNLSEQTKEAAAIYLKGTDKRTDGDVLHLADLALKARDADMFQEAFRDSSQAVRDRFRNEGGDKRLLYAFTSKQDDDALGRSYPDEYYLKPDYLRAREIAEKGKLSTATLIRNNVSILGDSEKALEQALSMMPDEERSSYVNGRKLQGRKPQDRDESKLSEKEKQDLDFYRQTRAAIDEAANPTEVARWEDMIAHRGGSLVSRLAEHRGSFYHSSMTDVLSTIRNITPQEWDELRQPDGSYRADLERVLSTYLSDSQMTSAKGVLDEIQTAETFGSWKKPGTVFDKLQRHSERILSLENPAVVIRDIQEAFRQDPELRERVSNPKSEDDYLLRRRLEIAASRGMEFSDFKRYAQPLIHNGSLPLSAQLELMKGTVDDDEAGVYEALRHATPAELKAIERDPAAVLPFMNEEERKIARNIAEQNGEFRAEDKMRSYVIGAGTNEDEIKQLLKDLKPAEIEDMRRDYASKYGEDLSYRLVDELGSTDWKEARRHLLDEPETARDAFHRALDEYLGSRQGVGNAFADAWAGAGIQADQAINNFAGSLSRSSAEFKQLSPEEQQRLQQDIHDAMDRFRESKAAAADAVVDAVLFAAAIGAAKFTGGVSLSLLTKTALLGAAFKVSSKGVIIGSDYDLAQGVTDALTGGIDGATLVVGPPQLAHMLGMGQRAAATASTRVLEEAGETLIKQGAKDTLEKGMYEMMATAIANGSDSIDRKAIQALAGKVAKDASPETLAAVERAIAQNLNTSIKREMEDGVRALVRKAALDSAAGTVGGGASGAVRGAAEWNSAKSIEENLKMLAESTAVSASMGAAMATMFSLGFETIGKGLGAAGDLMRSKPAFSLESDVAVHGKVLKPGGEPVTIGRADIAGAGAPVSRQHLSLQMDDKGRLALVDHSSQGTYIKRAGSDIYDPIPIGEPTVIAPGDEIRLGSPNGPKLELDVRAKSAAPEARSAITDAPGRATDAGAQSFDIAAGQSGVFEPPKAKVEPILPGDDSVLSYKIGNEEYPLALEKLDGDKKGSEQWYYYSTRKEIPDSPVKVEIDTSSGQDLGKLQEVLIPALMKDPELRELAPVWKTFDPRLGVESPGRGQVTGQGNNAKGFTFYVDGPDEARALQKKLDEILANSDLRLDAPLETGNVQVDRGRSNRVGIVRDRWEAAIGADGTILGARLDDAQTRGINEMFGLGAGQTLSSEQLRVVEEAAGIKPDTLFYDSEGRLSLRKVSSESGQHPGGGYYADERLAGKTRGALTDRQALYALSDLLGLDQVDMAAGKPAPPDVVPPFAPVPPDAGRAPSGVLEPTDKAPPSPERPAAAQPEQELPEFDFDLVKPEDMSRRPEGGASVPASPDAALPADATPAPAATPAVERQRPELARVSDEPGAAPPETARAPDQPVEPPTVLDKTVILERPIITGEPASAPAAQPSTSHRYYELEVEGRRAGASGPKLTIGSSNQASIPVNNAAVGPNHVQVRFSDEAVYLKSLDNERGTFLNGRRLGPDEEVAIRPGDRVTLGEPPQGAELNLFHKPCLDSTTPVVLKVGDREVGPGKPARIRAGGSAVDATVRVDESGHIYFKDNGSALGTYVNGKRVMPGDEVPLKAGDAVTHGNEVFGEGRPMPVAVESRPRYSLQVGPTPLDLSQGPVLIGRGRNGITDRAVSTNHATVEMRDTGVAITDHSRNGTWVLREGNEIKLTKGQAFELKPSDQVYLGKPPSLGGERLDLISLEAHPDVLPPREVLRATQELSPQALRQSNEFASTHEISARLEDGWQNAGALNEVGKDGSFKSPYPRVATVVDRANDPVLRQTIDDARRRFGHLPPRERADALAGYVKQLFTPPEMIGPDGSEKALDNWYAAFNNDHQGERILLGEFIRQGKGVCSQQATLLKILADELGLPCTLVRGNGRDGGNGINHAWTTFDFGDGGTPLIYDPRQEKLAKAPSDVPSHKAGRDINRDLGFTVRPDHGYRPGDRVDFDDIGGWRIESLDPKTKDAVLVHDAERSLRQEDFARLNGRDLPRIGERYQMQRSDGSIEAGWRFEGLNPDGTLRFYKEDAVRRQVSSLELYTGSE